MLSVFVKKIYFGVNVVKIKRPTKETSLWVGRRGSFMVMAVAKGSIDVEIRHPTVKSKKFWQKWKFFNWKILEIGTVDMNSWLPRLGYLEGVFTFLWNQVENFHIFLNCVVYKLFRIHRFLKLFINLIDIWNG